MGLQKQHDQNDPDLLPLTDEDSLDDWEGVAAPGPVRLGMTVSVCFDPESARVVRSAARRSEHTLAEFVRQAALTAATATPQRRPPAAPAGANTAQPANRRELEHAGT